MPPRIGQPDSYPHLQKILTRPIKEYGNDSCKNEPFAPERYKSLEKLSGDMLLHYQERCQTPIGGMVQI